MRTNIPLAACSKSSNQDPGELGEEEPDGGFGGSSSGSIAKDGSATPLPECAEATKDIFVSVWFDSTDHRFGSKVLQALSQGEASTLRQFTYLERRKDGKRLFLQEYIKPGKVGSFGARFVFPRTVDGQPFITPDSGEVRFHTELGTNQDYKVDRRFRVADMIYNGTLEY